MQRSITDFATSSDKGLPECRYGAKCYRKNADHLKRFRHPPEETSKEQEESKDSDEEPLPTRKKMKTAEDATVADKKDPEDKCGDAGPAFLPESATYDDRKNLIKQYFLFDMPDDFYALWDLADSLNSNDPCNAFNELGLILCGPFDIMAGKFDIASDLSADDLLIYCRFYYDVPEFQTIVKRASDDDGESSLFHIGYLRDEPDKDPIVCSNDGTDCKLTIVGDNIFAAINDYAKQMTKKQTKESTKKLVDAIVTEAEERGYSLDKNSVRVKERKKKTVAKTFHGAGIVVPMEGDVGYRPLGQSESQLKKTLQQMCDEDEDKKELRDRASSSLQELITYVQFANDECDFGMGYELGIDLFCSGYEKLHVYVDQLLSVAYTLLQREQFKTILDAHLKKRRC